MCPKSDETPGAKLPQFRGSGTRNRIVKRPKLKPVAAFGKLKKLSFFPKNFTKMDFLTSKCTQNLPKRLAPNCPSSKLRVCEIGWSKGPNWSRWRPSENCQNFLKMQNFGLKMLKNAQNDPKFQFLGTKHKITWEYHMYPWYMHSDQKKSEKNTPPPKPPSWVTVSGLFRSFQILYWCELTGPENIR